MTIMTLAAALAVQILPAPGTVRWELMVEEPSGSSFLDPASLVRNGDLVRYVNRTDRLVDQGDGIRMLIVQVAIDCRRRMLGFVQGDAYGEGGRFLRSVPGRPGGPAMQPLVEAPGPDRVFRRICGGGG
jgi:hypothetical protein